MSPSRVSVADDKLTEIEDTWREAASAPPSVQPNGAAPPEAATCSEKVTTIVRRSATSADTTAGAMPSEAGVAA